MKRLSALVCASVMALAAQGAFAASTTTAIVGDADSIKACTSKGGIVSTSASGQKSCTLPSASCSTTKLRSGTWSVIDINDEAAVRACFDACGKISTDTSGQQFCTKPAAPLAPVPSREPHN